MRGARISPGLLRSSHARLPARTLRSFFTPSLSSARSQSTCAQRSLFLLRSQRTILARRFHTSRPFRSGEKPNQTSHAGPSSEPAPSLSQRLKRLTREYGWAALGIYFALSALDFPFCFMAVRALGTERIGHYEHVAVQFFKNLIGRGEDGAAVAANADAAQATAREGDLGWADGIDEADARNQGPSASIWTQLALAYAIHKSFIFFRIPLTAAVTPKIVKTLRGWGWNIGKMKPKTPSNPTPK